MISKETTACAKSKDKTVKEGFFCGPGNRRDTKRKRNSSVFTLVFTPVHPCSPLYSPLFIPIHPCIHPCSPLLTLYSSQPCKYILLLEAPKPSVQFGPVGPAGPFVRGRTQLCILFTPVHPCIHPCVQVLRQPLLTVCSIRIKRALYSIK